MSKRLAGRLGCSEGQAMTVLIGLVLGLVTAVIGIPPALRHRASVSSAAPRISAERQTSASASPLPSDAPPVTSAPAPGATPGIPFTSASAAPPAADQGAPAAAPRRGALGLFARVPNPGAPEGIAAADDGTVYVATDNAIGRGGPGPSKVLRYNASGALQSAVEIAGQPANRTVGVTGLALEPRGGGLLVADGSTGRIIHLDPAGGQRTVATLLDLPACGGVVAAPFGCEPGAVNHRPLPRGMVVDAAGVVYVTDAGQGIIWRIDATTVPRPLHGDAAYFGSAALGGIAIGRAGELLFVAGRIYALPLDTTGQAGTRRQFAEISPGDGALGVAADASGVYVALTKINRILVLSTDGVERARIASGEGDPLPLDAPSGIAVSRARLLITNQSATNAADNWAVLSATP
jgi:sugar lactone lactonase YvrE